MHRQSNIQKEEREHNIGLSRAKKKANNAIYKYYEKNKTNDNRFANNHKVKAKKLKYLLNITKIINNIGIITMIIIKIYNTNDGLLLNIQTLMYNCLIDGVISY